MNRGVFASTCLIITGLLFEGCNPSQEQLSTQTAIAATAAFEALPTSTPTRTSTTIPTPTLTPTETPTEIPKLTETATVAPTDLPANWAEEYFIPVTKQQELRDKGATILTDLPADQWKDFVVTGPGQAYVACNGKLTLKGFKDKKSFVAFSVDRAHYGDKICTLSMKTQKEYLEYLQVAYPLESPETIQQWSERFLHVSETINPYLPKDWFYWDLYYGILLAVNPETRQYNWLIVEMGNDGNNKSVIKFLPLPLPTPTTTP